MAPPITCACGECQKCKAREYMRNWYRRGDNAEKQRQSQLASRERRKEYVLAYDKARGSRSYNKEKERVRRLVSHAIEKGNIERPPKCDRCDEEGGIGNDGRSLIQAHHSDYSKPFEIDWLCSKCHGKEHRKV